MRRGIRSRDGIRHRGRRDFTGKDVREEMDWELDIGYLKLGNQTAEAWGEKKKLKTEN